jgi:ABC-type bacteriocin transporter
MIGHKKILIKQYDSADCAAACLASIAAHYKLFLPLSKIRQYAGTAICGTNLLGLIEAANKMGFEAKGVKGKIASLKKIPLPAIGHLVVNKSLHHYVVIYKVNDTAIDLMNPDDGKMHHLRITEFADRWTGILLLLVPNETFRAGNQKIANSTRFWYLIRPHFSVILLALFGSLLYTALGLCTAIFVQKIIDDVLAERNRSLLNLMCMTMIAVVLVRLLIGAIKNMFTIRTGQQIDAGLILGYYRHLLKLPQHFFDSMRVGEVISRVNDAVKIRVFMNDISLNLATNIFIVIFSFGLMFTYYWKLALLMTIFVPFYVLVHYISNRMNKKIQRELMEDSAELESQLVESLNNVGTIKSLGLEEFANNKIKIRFVKLLSTIYDSGKLVVISSTTVELISQLLTITMLWVGAGLVLEHEITVGQLFSFYALIGCFIGPLASLINANQDIQDAIIAADRLYEIMDLDIENDTASIELTPMLIGDIRFENVAFRYANRVDVFNKLNLNIKAGSFTALVGESGSGKSTLIALLRNIYPIQEGDIFIGKYAIKYLTNDSLRRQLCVVPQKADIFNGNVIDNIAVGVDEPDMKQIMRICMELDILKFIENLPKGFDTYLGENGVMLSGGQKQRISLARALYRNPEVLILDEATSSLDTLSEQFVQRALNLLVKQHKTIIVIAHRLTTVCHADHIIVLDKGRMIEEGTHQEMMSVNGHYYKLWQQQFEGIDA